MVNKTTPNLDLNFHLAVNQWWPHISVIREQITLSGSVRTSIEFDDGDIHHTTEGISAKKLLSLVGLQKIKKGGPSVILEDIASGTTQETTPLQALYTPGPLGRPLTPLTDFRL
ncbi:MAG: hypothetical protein KDI46_08270 [Alphaproteobacteria bacterium]|nr:hypothetical protein [Alphaproteobacteria bacterium]